MPALDANMCGDWTENQISLYQALPYYLAKYNVDLKKGWTTFSPLTKTRKWIQNQGPILRGVRTNPSPNMRQFANPRPISMVPLTDVMNVRETTVEAQVRAHRFESPIFNFYPSFNDFMDHIDDNGKDIMEKVERFNELFLRGNMFHMSPWMFVCNADGSLTKINAPYWSGSGVFDPATQGKTPAFLAANLPSGTLSISALEQALTIAETDLGVPFFKGSDLPKDDQPLDGKFLIINSSEKWNQWIFDPYVKANRPIDMDIIHDGYRGSFFGRATTKLEFNPIRYTAAGVFKQPEVRADDAEYDAGETLPNPDYTDPAVSPYEIGWICGKNGYESIEVGAPPSQFTGNTFPNAPKMDWSGKPFLTKNFLLKCLDSDGNVTFDTNSYGRYLKFQAEATYGVLATQRRNIIPIAFLRQRGIALPVV